MKICQLSKAIENLRRELRTGKTRYNGRILSPEEITHRQQRVEELCRRRERVRASILSRTPLNVRLKNRCRFLRWQIKHKRRFFKSKTSLGPGEIAELQRQLEALEEKGPVALTDSLPTNVNHGVSPAAGAVEQRLEPAPSPLAPGVHDLYIMENSRIPGELKIGYSKNVSRRQYELQQAQNFKINVLAVFPGKGYMEKEVHDRLRVFQVSDCAGNEWFKCSLGEALAAIDQVMRCA